MDHIRGAQLNENSGVSSLDSNVLRPGGRWRQVDLKLHAVRELDGESSVGDWLLLAARVNAVDVAEGRSCAPAVALSTAVTARPELDEQVQ